MSIFTTLLNCLFPFQCIFCTELSSEFICNGCFSKWHFISSNYCLKCGSTYSCLSAAKICFNCLSCAPFFDIARSMAFYNDLGVIILHKCKFYDQIYLIPYCAKMLAERGGDIFNDMDLIMPVPSRRSRIIKRRCNQVSLLAKEVARRVSIPFDGLNMIRVKKTALQRGLSVNERLNNVRGAFTVRFPEKISGKGILIIDDLMTTGATLNECSKSLVKAGAKSVNCLTLFRTVY
ncbi:competence protein ComFC [Candidatus Xenohaliotis californiensis]|uniref:Competence protein ComFC n=1 Tax=Candidatus Xenohaliotis californiensis TaxID=84677 RepID=A0ABP0ETS6_9RICK|nr:competence protein ComFC [Candidatus Xenohaliotis californiensis]